MTSYPSYPELSQGTTTELSQPSLIGEGSSGAQLPAELSQGQLEPTAPTRATPKRVQQRRTKGWRKPEGALVVTRWTKWANPFIIGEAGMPNAKTAVELYRMFVRIPGNPLAALLPELTGHDLACWCPPDQPCHADVLLELANP